MEPDSVREAFRGQLIQVDVERWPHGEREIVRHPGASAVVAFTPLGDVLLVRQTREAIRTELLEIPAGIRDQPDESAEECAVRELMEETGYRAARIQPLGAIYTSPGFADERIDLFLADAVPGGDRTEIGLEVVEMPFAAALSASGDGRIMDAKTVAGLLLARDVQDRRGRGAPPGSASG